jgi:Holliday junction resolvasome RuvABC ATP-dependent DNA helicase subunit
MISKPLMSRFQITYNIPHYNLRELARIIRYKHREIKLRNALRIAKNTVTPREAINLAWRVLALGKDVQKNLEFIGYKYGLSKTERFYLKIIKNLGTASLNSLCSALQLDKEEIKHIEDSLIRKKLVLITPKGRKLTVKGILKVKEIRSK